MPPHAAWSRPIKSTDYDEVISQFRDAWSCHAYVFDVTGGDSRVLVRFKTTDFVSAGEVPKQTLQRLKLALSSASDSDDDFERLLVIGARNAEGFDIVVYVSGATIVADFGGLVQDFENLDLAMMWVERALSRSYRLCIVKVAGVAREWRLEPDRPATEAAFDTLASGHSIWKRPTGKTEMVFRRNGTVRLRPVSS